MAHTIDEVVERARRRLVRVTAEQAAAEIFHDLAKPKLDFRRADWREDSRNAIRNARKPKSCNNWLPAGKGYGVASAIRLSWTRPPKVSLRKRMVCAVRRTEGMQKCHRVYRHPLSPRV